MSKTFELRADMGEILLNHLSQTTELPRFGVLAGQAVASAIDDLWGAGGGVYNDFDVFLPSSIVIPNKCDVSTLAHRVKPIAMTRQYGGATHRHLELVQTYRIELVQYTGIINRIYFRLPGGEMRCGNHARRIISGFDINAVRVGIDIATKELVWDAHYEQFLRTRELRIAACYTPAHTLIRLLKKSQELANVSLDLETAARITAMLQTDQLFEELNTSRTAAYFFGEKFATLAKSFSGQMLPYYELTDAWFHRQHSRSEWRSGCGDETTADAWMLHGLTARGGLDKLDEDFATEMGALSVVALPSHVYRQRDTRTTGFSYLTTAPALPPALPAESHLDNFAKVRGADYFDALSTSDEDIKVLLAFLDHEQKSSETMGWTAAEQLLFAKGLSALSKNSGSEQLLSAELVGALAETVPLSLELLEHALPLAISQKQVFTSEIKGSQKEPGYRRWLSWLQKILVRIKVNAS
jgi:hypothetical protein